MELSDWILCIFVDKGILWASNIHGRCYFFQDQMLLFHILRYANSVIQSNSFILGIYCLDVVYKRTFAYLY